MQKTSQTEDLVFVVGYPRSGTTMMASWLTGFPGVAVTPETHFFGDLFDSHLRPRGRNSTRALKNEFLARLRFQDLGLKEQDLLPANSPKRIKRSAFFQICLGAFARREKASLVVEKTPENLFHLTELLREFPQAKVIVIIRDPRDCILSLQKTPWSQRSDNHNALEWQWAHRKLRQLLRRKPQQVLTVSYEEFLDNHQETALKIATHLNQDLSNWTQGQVAGTAIPAWESAWKAKASTRLDAFCKRRWHSADPEFVEGIDGLIGNEMRRWGYDAGPTQLTGKILAGVFPVLPWARRWRIKMTYGTGLSKDLPSERFLKSVLPERR